MGIEILQHAKERGQFEGQCSKIGSRGNNPCSRQGIQHQDEAQRQAGWFSESEPHGRQGLQNSVDDADACRGKSESDQSGDGVKEAFIQAEQRQRRFADSAIHGIKEPVKIAGSKGNSR